jgi:hypothetical protein
MKANMACFFPNASLSKKSKEIIKILGAAQTTLLPHIVIGAFEQLGIVTTYSPTHNCLMCHVDPPRARRVRGLGTGTTGQGPGHLGRAHGSGSISTKRSSQNTMSS